MYGQLSRESPRDLSKLRFQSVQSISIRIVTADKKGKKSVMYDS